MKLNLRQLISMFALLFILPFSPLRAQLTISGELRPRAEYRHGFSSLAEKDMQAAFFVSQRSRLNFNFQQEKVKFGLSLQDVRVWGDLNQLARQSNSQMIHQAWGEYAFTKKMALRFGRMELVYDDSRILGNVGWAQQARAHDLALLTYEGNYKLHIGLAYNQEAENRFGTNYTIPSYKSMQFLWYNRKIKAADFSMLLLNNGMQHDYVADGAEKFKTVYSQTIGGRIALPSGRVSTYTEGYYTTGKDAMDRNLEAFMLKLGGSIGLSENLRLHAGWEYLSGTDQEKDPEAEDFINNSFTPFYGTNHKFNGHMDYFYVGNHANSVGLSDLYAGLTFSRNQFGAYLRTHLFSAAAEVTDGQGETMEAFLGTEIDLSINYKLSGPLTVHAGYSQIFGTATLQQLKGGNYRETNNWAWIMLSFTPVFL